LPRQQGQAKRDGLRMIRTSFNWTAEDRLTRARWMRGVTIFYGCIALFVLGFMLIKPLLVEHPIDQAMDSRSPLEPR
jgi:hypothetical protein